MRVGRLIFMIGACGGGSAAPRSSAPAPQAAIPPQSAVPGVYAKACETECADSLAQLVTYRDAKGAIALVTVQGSPSTCSNPPLRFLRADGTERAVIPLQPVVPGSPEANKFDDIQKTQLAGLTKAETMLCRDVKH